MKALSKTKHILLCLTPLHCQEFLYKEEYEAPL